MEHKNCGGPIYYTYQGISNIGLTTDKNGDPKYLAFDEPCGEIDEAKYVCMECEKCWLDKETMLLENK